MAECVRKTCVQALHISPRHWQFHIRFEDLMRNFLKALTVSMMLVPGLFAQDKLAQDKPAQDKA